MEKGSGPGKTAPSSAIGWIAADAHVHLYENHDLAVFFETAGRNLKGALSTKGDGSKGAALLFLADRSGQHWFRRFREMANEPGRPLGKATGKWTFHLTREEQSLWVELAGRGGFFLLAGRQVITAEKLELLALATDASFEEGRPVHELLVAVAKEGGLPVLPWAFGKWMGQRGRTVEALLTNTPTRIFFVGDNRNRPRGWPRSRLVKEAERQGVRVLPGSDPLPFSDEVSRVGSFGFLVQGLLDPEHPARDVKRVLTDPGATPSPYGVPDSPIRFLWNQARLRLAGP